MKLTLLIFLLMVGLIAVVYYVGFSSDVNALTKAGQIFGFTYTGRNAQGQFAGYPGGNAQVYTPQY